MSRRRLYLFDTTLRDGQQTAGVDFSVADKIRISQVLDQLGLDYIEGGYPGANPTDSQFFETAPPLEHASLTAFGMTKRAGRSVDNDPGFKEILDAPAAAVCLVAKSWDYHVDVALGIPREDNLQAISDSVQAVLARGREAMIDCEHFFDGYKANPDYALSCIDAALSAGARWAVLCDTNGGTLPSEVYDIICEVRRRFDGAMLGIHAHNDTDNAVANSIAAVEAGVCQLQGTLNGLGERCGNANMISLIPSLMLKPHLASQVEVGISPDKLEGLMRVSRMLDDILNQTPNRHAPYVGASAFAHKGGIHVSAVMRDPSTYEHVPPEAVGNRRVILVSDQAGKSNILDRLATAGIPVERDDPAIDRILMEVKRKEAAGYSFDGVGASFEILALSELGRLPDYFQVLGYSVNVTYDEKMGALSEAHIKLIIDGETVENTGQGNGPINALDQAFRGDLRRYAGYLDDMNLIDYKVRILNTGTGAITRVTVESGDAAGETWRTIGVNANIVVASFEALRDAVIYKLVRDNVSATPN